MSKLINALSRIGLLEYEDGDPAAVEPPAKKRLPSTAAVSEVTTAATPSKSEPMAEPSDASPSVESQSLEQIYAAANIAKSAYPAERFLKLVDGLRALELTTRKAAVLAIDAADDSWSIDDPLRDATAKVKALRTEQTRLASAAQAADAKAATDLAVEQDKLMQVTRSIRQEIAALEQRLQGEVESSAISKAAIEASAKEERRRCEAEVARLGEEMARLEQVHTFAPEPARSTESGSAS